MPTTPGCHSGEARTMLRRWEKSGSRSRRPRASSRMSCSIPWRSWLSWSSSAASSVARAGSSVVSSSTPRRASASRPPALRRGARRNPTAPVVTASVPLTALSAATPGRVDCCQLAQPVLYEDAVLFDEWDDVGDGAEGDEVERPAQVGQGGRSGFPQVEPDPEGQVEGDPGAAQAAKRKPAVRFDGIEHRVGRQRRARYLVVVADDRVDAEIAGAGDFTVADAAAVDRNHEAGPGCGELADGAFVHAVAFAQPVRNVEDRLGAERAQEAHEQCAPADAVDVVVAVDGDAFTAPQGLPDPRRRGAHVPEQQRRPQVTVEAGPEEGVGRLRRGDAARHQEPGDERRDAALAAQPGFGLGVRRTQSPAPRHRALSTLPSGGAALQVQDDRARR